MAMNYEQASEVVRSVRLLAMVHRGRVGELLREHGLQPGQEVLLLDLFALGQASQIQLATLAQVDEPSVCRSLARLERQGLIERLVDKQDGRRRVVVLSPEGRALIPKLKQVYITLADETVGDSDEKTRKRALKNVREISQRFITRKDPQGA